jgi:hypothetical protein
MQKCTAQGSIRFYFVDSHDFRLSVLAYAHSERNLSAAFLAPKVQNAVFFLCEKLPAGTAKLSRHINLLIHI